MSIQVKTRLLSPRKNDFTDEVISSTINIVVEGFADQVKGDVESMQCEKHPDQISYVTIIGNRHGQRISIEKEFCCDEFSQKVTIDVNPENIGD